MDQLDSTETLGIVGGLGKAAGLYYYSKLIDEFAKHGKELRLFIAHADFPTVSAYGRNGEIALLTEYLARLIDSLVRSGATVAAVSAAAPHVCFNELASVVSVPLISLLDAVSAQLTKSRLRRVTLFGTRQVIESDFFGALVNCDVVRPRPEEIEYIDSTYRALVGRGTGTVEDRDAFEILARTLYERERIDAIVLAGTDLSPLFDEYKSSLPLVDCARIHVEALTHAVLNEN